MSASHPVARPPVRTILVVEDNEDDLFALQRAAKEAGVRNPLQIVTDGQQAVNYLAGVARYQDRTKYPLPSLVLLDLKLPYVAGFDVLAWLRRQAPLEHVAVVVLTSSNEDRDHARACAGGARSYLVKPVAATDLRNLMDSMRGYWGDVAADDALGFPR